MNLWFRQSDLNLANFKEQECKFLLSFHLAILIRAKEINAFWTIKSRQQLSFSFSACKPRGRKGQFYHQWVTEQTCYMTCTQLCYHTTKSKDSLTRKQVLYLADQAKFDVSTFRVNFVFHRWSRFSRKLNRWCFAWKWSEFPKISQSS